MAIVVIILLSTTGLLSVALGALPFNDITSAMTGTNDFMSIMRGLIDFFISIAAIGSDWSVRLFFGSLLAGIDEVVASWSKDEVLAVALMARKGNMASPSSARMGRLSTRGTVVAWL